MYNYTGITDMLYLSSYVHEERADEKRKTESQNAQLRPQKAEKEWKTKPENKRQQIENNHKYGGI